MSDNQFKCPPCGEGFNSKEELVLHAHDMHSKKEEQQTVDEKAQHSCATC